MSDISVFGDSVLKGVIYENNVYKVSKNRFSNICEEVLGISVENKAKFGSTINVGKQIIYKNIDLIKETKSIYVVMEFGGNDCDYNWKEISEDPDKEYHPKSTIAEFIEIYSDLISELKSIGKIPVLVSLPPIDSYKYFNYISKKLNADNILKWMEGNKQFLTNWHERYNIEVFKLAINNNVPIIDITSKFLEIKNYSDLLCDDGIHPNEKGHMVIADAIKEHIEKKKIEILKVPQKENR